MKKLIIVIEIILLACMFTGSERHVTLSDTKTLNTPDFNWENYNIIIHALGGLDGFTYLNSRESFINYYDKGCRLFEVDLTKTSDGGTACSLQREFQNFPVCDADGRSGSWSSGVLASGSTGY